ncbi:MAG TPA: hypothetical protein VGA80_15245 [Flavobacteriaceae bacterium]
MTELNKPIFTFKTVILIIGIILLLFGSLYIFTRPAYWNSFDFSETGQIGDTIGGITAPIINIIGAILIFLSFKAQINANKIQFKLLSQEMENQKKDRNFQVTLEIFQSLKNDYQNLENESFRGQGALNSFVNSIKSYWDEKDFKNHLQKTIYADWKFIMAEYDLISYHIESSEFRENEQRRLSALLKNYYFSQLEYANNILIKEFEKHNIESDILSILKSSIEFNKSENNNG